MKNILIGGAWPYDNGSLHIGHIASLLSGDVLARYWRAKGARVFYVSGSDCYGTPITIRAAQEGRSPGKISARYHREFCETFEKLGFSYDRYTHTTHPEHIDFVQEFHRRLYDGGYVEERTTRAAFCTACRKELTDRMVVGRCPACGEPTRGDQCDACGEVLEPENVLDAACAECGTKVSFRETTQLYLLVSKLEQELRRMLDVHPAWRRNAAAFTRRYLDEGLRDRAITRDLDWGIDVPKAGYEEKKIYIWAENVLGYLSAANGLCGKRGVPFAELFGRDARHYYVHGKDNVPFHTIILPALLLAEGAGFRLPDDIISSEYVTLDGEKMSTSRGHAVWADELLERYHPDAIRYFFLANGPEKRDADFTFADFASRCNADLAGIWGNFVNRTLAFTAKYLGNTVPEGTPNTELAVLTEETFAYAGRAIADGRFRDALQEIFEIVRAGNRYYDRETPWKTRTEEPRRCAETIYNCTQLVGSLAVLLQPFLPFTSQRVLDWLGLTDEWNVQTVQPGRILPPLSILFERIAP